MAKLSTRRRRGNAVDRDQHIAKQRDSGRTQAAFSQAHTVSSISFLSIPFLICVCKSSLASGGAEFRPARS